MLTQEQLADFDRDRFFDRDGFLVRNAIPLDEYERFAHRPLIAVSVGAQRLRPPAEEGVPWFKGMQ